MRKPQWITIGAGIFLLAVLFIFGRTIPDKKSVTPGQSASNNFSIDSLLLNAKKRLSPPQVDRLTSLEHLVVRGNVKDQQLQVYHDLSHFWKDSAKVPELYLWYQAEAARLENSEKSLTFAGRLFLDNLVEQNRPEIKSWEAFQAKDLFERSLKLNPLNDSSKVSLGAVYIYGGIASPMQGIGLVKEVADRDSANVYAQLTLGVAAMMSGQIDKALDRFRKVAEIQPKNIEALFRVGNLYEQTGNKTEAIRWYSKMLPLLEEPDAKNLEKKIAELSK